MSSDIMLCAVILCCVQWYYTVCSDIILCAVILCCVQWYYAVCSDINCQLCHLCDERSTHELEHHQQCASSHSTLELASIVVTVRSYVLISTNEYTSKKKAYECWQLLGWPLCCRPLTASNNNIISNHCINRIKPFSKEILAQ